MDRRLADRDVQALLWFLRVPVQEETSLEPLSENSIKNDVLDILIAQDSLPPELGRQMVAMYRDLALDDMWREYCVQHFAPYYERRWSPADEGRLQAAERTEVEAAFQEAAHERQGGIAGAALIGLERLSGQYPEIGQEKVRAFALDMATDPVCSPASRITAVATCGYIGEKGILPAARILAQTGEVIPLRLAAIGAIGAVGNADDIDLLESILAGSEEPLKHAAEAASRAIRSRSKG